MVNTRSSREDRGWAECNLPSRPRRPLRLAATISSSSSACSSQPAHFVVLPPSPPLTYRTYLPFTHPLAPFRNSRVNVALFARLSTETIEIPSYCSIRVLHRRAMLLLLLQGVCVLKFHYIRISISISTLLKSSKSRGLTKLHTKKKFVLHDTTKTNYTKYIPSHSLF